MEEKSILDELEDSGFDESSAPFYECLTGYAQKNLFINEAYSRKVLNIKHLDDDQYEKLRTTKTS
jgi:hypothetical protein